MPLELLWRQLHEGYKDSNIKVLGIPDILNAQDRNLQFRFELKLQSFLICWTLAPSETTNLVSVVPSECTALLHNMFVVKALSFSQLYYVHLDEPDSGLYGTDIKIASHGKGTKWIRDPNLVFNFA